MTTPVASGAGAAAAALGAAGRVLIVSHRDPDGDAIGSSIGLALALDALGIANDILLGSGAVCPATYAWLPGSDRCVTADALAVSGTAWDAVAVLDSPDLSRLGDAEALARSGGRIVVIDHHPGDGAEAAVSWVDTAAPAVGVLIWELLPLLGVTPSAEIATCLYAALVTDTGRFSYSNATPRAFRAAAGMVEAGANANEAYLAIYETRSPGAQALLTRTLARLELANGGLVAYSWISEQDFVETGADRAEAENLIDAVRPLAGIEVALLAKCSGDTVRMSLRAKGDYDVSAVARAFGGGGHRAAAGFTYAGELPMLLGNLLPMLPGGRS